MRFPGREIEGLSRADPQLLGTKVQIDLALEDIAKLFSLMGIIEGVCPWGSI